MSQDLVLQALVKAGKPMRPGEIAEATGLDKKDVEKAIKSLKTSEKIFSPKMCFYQAK